MRPVFDKLFVENMNLSLYEHDLRRFYNTISLLKKTLEEAKVQTLVTITHIVKDYDSLRLIAVKYYDDISMWRKLAIFNKLDSTELTTGTTIEIPDKRILNGL